MSTYRDSDPCTDIILDFIAGGVEGNPSGESKGNYNAVIGNIHAHADLSQRRLSAIYGLQNQLVAAGYPSGAVGRYQFIHSTLKGLAEQLALSGATWFTLELQDRLAVELLKRRGYKDWWRDLISDEQFAHNISEEWASLPDPERDGRSHYAGMAGNHASCTLEVVYAMLEEARRVRRG